MGAAALLFGGACAHAAGAANGTAEETTVAESCDQTVAEASGDSLAAALKDARDGGVVCVPAGTYVGSFNLKRSVTLRGLGGDRGAVVLQGDGRKSILSVQSASIVVILEGLTLRGGSAPSGGALSMAQFSDVTVRDCAFEGGSSSSYGGGAIFASRGRVTVAGSAFLKNGGGNGGALLADGVSKWAVTDSTFVGNAGRFGGAIAIKDGADVVLERCTLTENVGEAGGGATIFVTGTTTRGPTLRLRGTTVQGGDPPIFNEDDRGTITQEG